MGQALRSIALAIHANPEMKDKKEEEIERLILVYDNDTSIGYMVHRNRTPKETSMTFLEAAHTELKRWKKEEKSIPLEFEFLLYFINKAIALHKGRMEKEANATITQFLNQLREHK